MYRCFLKETTKQNQNKKTKNKKQKKNQTKTKQNKTKQKARNPPKLLETSQNISLIEGFHVTSSPRIVTASAMLDFFRYPFTCYTTQKNIQHGRHGRHNLRNRVRAVSWKPSIADRRKCRAQGMMGPLRVNTMFSDWCLVTLSGPIILCARYFQQSAIKAQTRYLPRARRESPAARQGGCLDKKAFPCL